MATVNRTPGSDKQNFKAIETHSWSSIYLPAICAGVVMIIVLFLAVSCSKRSDNPAAKIRTPETRSIESPAAAAAAAAEAPKKAVKKHRPTTATYVSETYGVSFTYPRKYSLLTAAKQQETPVLNNFSRPGAVEIVSLDMPRSLYPETDFSSALLDVSVKQEMTAEECGQFATLSNDTATAKSFPAASLTGKDGDQVAKLAADVAKPKVVKLGTNEFSEVEQMSGSNDPQSDLKYFHLFNNGACYEFALEVETSRKADEDLAQVDRGKVFQQLEKILASVRIKDVELAGTENTEKRKVTQPMATTQANAKSMQTEKAQVITPEQK